MKAVIRPGVKEERFEGLETLAPSPRLGGHGSAPPGLAPGTVRTALQRRAPATVRRHAIRHMGQVASLLMADLAAYLLLRTGIRAIRDASPPASWLHGFVTAYFPQGFLGGWQFAGALLIGLVVTGSYVVARTRRDSTRLLTACIMATALVLWTPFWTEAAGIATVQFMVTVPLVWMALAGGRAGVNRFVSPLWMNGRGGASALLVGPAGAIREAMRRPALLGTEGLRIRASVVVDDPSVMEGAGSLGEMPEIIHRTGVDTIFVCGYVTDEQLNKVVDASVTAGCELLTFARSLTVAGVTPEVVWQSDHPFIRLTTPALRAQHLLIKRVMDLTASILGLVVLAPVFALIAAGIKLDSRGPVFFRQSRAGLGGRRFKMLKFRTMRMGADGEKQRLQHLNHTGDPRLFKILDDPRITRLGRFLRRWSLDELPQLWNVLVGDMSLVGPRPFFECDLETYEEHHFRRLGAKPGITGLWQVKGRSSVVDFEEVVRMDREYIERWSVGMDLRILALTIPAVVRRTGAY